MSAPLASAATPVLDPVALAVSAAGGLVGALPQLVQIFRDLGGEADKPVADRLQAILGQVSEVDRAAAEADRRAAEVLAAPHPEAQPAEPAQPQPAPPHP